MSEKTTSMSQSLFQTYYLGQTPVDRWCPTSVMPWIIEELKLHAETMKFVWLTPGPSGVSYVADNGQELFSHTYSNLIRYCIASDRISFAYITHQDATNNYVCHVFQALTYDEADMVMNQLRANVKPDLLSLTSNIGSSANASNTPTGEDNSIERHPKSRIRTNSAPLQTRTSTIEFNLRYIGSMEISHSSVTEKFLNTAATRFREAYTKKQKEKKKKKRKMAKNQSFTTLNSPGTISLSSFDSVDFPISEPPQSVITQDVPESSKYVLPTSAEEGTSPKEEGQAITVEVTRATPDRDEKLAENKGGIEGFQKGENDSGITTDGGVTKPNANGPMSSEKGCEQVGEGEESQPSPTDGKGTEETDGSADYREPQRPRSLYTEEVMVMMGPQNLPDKEDIMGEEEEQEIVDSVAAMTVRKRSLTVVPSGDAESQEDVASAGDQDKDPLAQRTQPSREKEQEEGEKEQERKPVERKKGEEVAADNFDTLPELDALHDSPEFQKLGTPKDLPGRRVHLMISGFSVTILSVNGGEQLLWKPIKQIACCIQGRKEPNFMGFSCREHGEKKFRFHLLRAEDKEMASKVLESFKSVFADALAATRPSPILCDSCPLQQLHELCQSIEGVSVPVAQSRIQECLATLSEADYARVMKKLKESELVDHDYTQMVALVAILRQHFQSKQENHTHPSVRTTEKQLSIEKSANTNRGRLSALERAKMALTSSFDNLRTRKQPKKAGSDDNSDRRSATPEPQGSQSLNLPSNVSPIFSKKTSVSSLMGPVSTGETAPNELKRSWSGSAGSFRLRRRKNLKKAASDEGSEEEKGKTQSHLDDKKTNSEQEQSSMVTENGDLQHAQSAPFSSIPPSLQSSTISPPLSPLLSSSRPGGKILESKSFPSHVFRTPTHSPVRTRRSVQPRGRRKGKKDDPLQRLQFTPPPTPTPVLPPMLLRGHQRSMSLRQDIFESVSTPTKTKRKASIDDFEWIDPPPIDQLGGGRTAAVRGKEDGKMSPHTRIRKLWKSAIQQQILLNRMDKENLLFEKAATEADQKRRKLCYKDPSLSASDSTQVWNAVLNQDKPSAQDIHKALMLGVPLNRRGEVWRFLIKQYQVQGRGLDCDLPTSTGQKSFQQLCEEDTEYKNSIQADIGRTFPSHPYFSKGSKQGQSSLYSILHAYAVADPEIGYCQGLSFLTGMLLMHSKDDEGAFEFLCQLMLVYDYRDVFAEDLSTLQVRLYQLSRLLLDLAPVLYQHFQELDITPFLYAAPWFLTVFASQFPIAFVARVLDFFFFEGPDFVFKIALSLLTHHTEAILQCDTMESTCIYLKNKLPEEVLSNMSNILEHALKLDFGNRLQVFETEYRVMEGLTASFPVELDAPDVEALNKVLMKQNRALIEQLAICHGAIHSLTDTVLKLQQKVEAQAEAQVEAQAEAQAPGPRIDRLGADTLNHQLSDEKEQ